MSYLSSRMLLVAAMAATLFSVGTAIATPITVNNFSFESPNVTNPPTTYASYPTSSANDWFQSGGDAGAFVPQGGDPAPTNGTQVGLANNFLIQTLSTTIVGGTTYTLLVDVGARVSFASGNLAYRLELLDNGSSVASTGIIVIPPAPLTTATLVYSPLTNGGTLGIRLSRISSSGNERQGLFDNVRLNAVAVPEPASLGMLGVSGVLAFVGLWNRRAKR